jgi:hypothetical protein
MVRRIKPVSRTVRAEARIRTRERAAGPAEPRLPDLGEVSLPAVDIYETATEFIVESSGPSGGTSSSPGRSTGSGSSPPSRTAS